MDLKEFLDKKAGSIEFDWDTIEKELGFPLHDGLKSFYSRVYDRFIRGEIKFKESEFLIPTGNAQFDTWFSFNKIKGNLEIRLDVIKSQEVAVSKVVGAFTEWKGGNDFGQRFLIGTLYTNIGSILILFNNETGKVEWMDCEYGYFKVYEQNPNGVFSNTVDEFIEKLAKKAV